MIHSGSDGSHYVEVGHLFTANTVRLPDSAMLQDGVDRTAMVVNAEPLPSIGPIPIDRDRFPFLDVANHRWDELFGVLSRAVIV